MFLYLNLKTLRQDETLIFSSSCFCTAPNCIPPASDQIRYGRLEANCCRMEKGTEGVEARTRLDSCPDVPPAVPGLTSERKEREKAFFAICVDGNC